jgi:hypothetical protein
VIVEVLFHVMYCYKSENCRHKYERHFLVKRKRQEKYILKFEQNTFPKLKTVIDKTYTEIKDFNKASKRAARSSLLQ